METVPDGGWGWMVVTGTAFMFIVTMGTIPCFGLIFGDFLISIGEGTASVTTITSVHISVCMITGLLNNRLSKSFSYRQIGCVGGCIFFLGALQSSFPNSLIHLIVSYGVVQGLGVGLMIPAAMSSFNSYFNIRRTTAMAVTQSINAAGSFLMPLLVQVLIDNYGFRGAQFVLSAVTLHALLGMVALQPVEKYMASQKTGLIKVTMDNECEENDAQVELIFDKNSDMEIPPSPTTKGFDDSKQRNFSTKYLMRNGNNKNKPCFAFWRWANEFLDLDLLANPVYFNITLGICFTNIADMTFFALEPIYLIQGLDFSMNSVSTIIAGGAAGDLIGRIFLAVVSQRLSRRNRLIFFVGVSGSVLHILVFIFVTNFYVIATLTAVLGFFRGCIYVTLALVFSEVVSVERYPAAFGLYHTMNGIMFFSIGPFIGIIRDVSRSYPLCFVALASLLMICVILWTGEFISKKCCSRR